MSDDAPLELVLEGGGHAILVETDGDRVTLRASRPYPPGSPLGASTEFGPLRVKVRGSRRVGDDDGERPYRVEGRFVNLSRATRLALTAPAEAGDSSRDG